MLGLCRGVVIEMSKKLTFEDALDFLQKYGDKENPKKFEAQLREIVKLLSPEEKLKLARLYDNIVRI